MPLDLTQYPLEKEIMAQMDLNMADFNLDRTKFFRYSQVHGTYHIYRVMMNVLQITQKRGSFETGKWAFLAAYIHDLARKNDEIEPEHGARCVETVLPHYEDLFRRYGAKDLQLHFIAEAVRQHSIKETIKLGDPGSDVIAILKDADALDRCRINALAPLRLRFDESRDLIDYAKNAYQNSMFFNTDNIEFDKFVMLARNGEKTDLKIT